MRLIVWQSPQYLAILTEQTWSVTHIYKPPNIFARARLKQWIVLKARADWLVKLRISCAIYLRAIRERVASRFACVTSEKSSKLIFLVYIISLF